MKISNDLTVSPELLEKLQQKIDVQFNNSSLFIEALLHGSFFSGDKIKMNAFKQKNSLENESYEKLEYLGDSVLNTVISECTYHNKEIENYAKNKGKTIENVLTAVKEVLVSNENLTPLAHKINLEKYILQKGLRNVEDVYANVMEAIIGAIFLDKGDQGYPEAKRFVSTFFDIKGALEKVDYLNPKGKLEKLCAKNDWHLEYILINEEGPDHNKRFTVVLYIDGEQVSIGEGSKIKHAEADAAGKYLQTLDEKVSKQGLTDAKK